MTKQLSTLSTHEVRLFPSVHITSVREAELRASASLLSVIRAVTEFGKTVVRAAGGPAGRISCHTEVPYGLETGSGKPPEEVRPDGVVQVVRGKTRWIAFFEVKVGNADLDPDQIEKYHRLARQEGASALITVSNQPALPDGRPPVTLDKRRLKSIPVAHFSWDRLLSEAQLLSRKKAVSDPDQAWMLNEWIRYVDDADSRIIVPPDLGGHWAVVLKAARTGALPQHEPELREVAECWMGYLRKAALRLRAKLGVDVHVRMSRKEIADSSLHVNRLLAAALTTGTLSGVLRVPDAVGDIRIDMFLHSRSVRYGVEVAAPTEGRRATRLKWLWRQLRGLSLPGDLVVTSDWDARGLLTTVPASEFLADPDALTVDRSGVSIPKEVHSQRFQLERTAKLLPGRGRSSAPVLEGITKGLEDFYLRVVEELVPFVPRAPRLATKKTEQTEGAPPAAHPGSNEDSPKGSAQPSKG